jgi:hypothetical protein
MPWVSRLTVPRTCILATCGTLVRRAMSGRKGCHMHRLADTKPRLHFLLWGGSWHEFLRVELKVCSYNLYLPNVSPFSILGTPPLKCVTVRLENARSHHDLEAGRIRSPVSQAAVLTGDLLFQCRKAVKWVILDRLYRHTSIISLSKPLGRRLGSFHTVGQYEIKCQRTICRRHNIRCTAGFR